MTAPSDAVPFDPFAHIVDDPEQTAQDLLDAQLNAAKRGWFPMRKTFVQRPQGSGEQEGRPSARASVLSDIVHGRHQRALDLLLLVHALQPVLDGTPLKLATWARLLSVKAPCTSTGVT